MSEPLFDVGDVVYVAHHRLPHWEGTVLSRNCVDEDDWEYRVSNAPQLFGGSSIKALAWEKEMSLVKDGLSTMQVAYVIRPHPTKNKPLVTPCLSLTQVSRLMSSLQRQGKQPVVKFPKKNISSGEDCYV